MAFIHLWNMFLYLLTTEVGTGNALKGHEKDIMHAIAGHSFLIRTWQLNGSYLFITIKKGSITLFDTLMSTFIGRHKAVQNGRMLLKYNHTLEQVVLMFENVSKQDRGHYEMEERFHKSRTTSYEIETEAHERQDGRWDIEINVLGPGEVKQGLVGENISMEFEKSIKESTLYIYDQMVALFVGSSCSVLRDSYLYGRLSCASDVSGKMYKITIEYVSQRDAGLYRVATGRNETGQCFFNIQDRPTYAVAGDNMTIGWFYNQQGIERSLRVIHPNQGVMMLLALNNVPQVKSNFQHRLLYSGEATKSFMSFTMISLKKSDEGLYTIETLHGTTIPGSKELIVEDISTTRRTSIVIVILDSRSIKTLHYVTKQILHGQQTTVGADISITNRTGTVIPDSSSIKTLNYARTKMLDFQKTTVGTVSLPIHLVPAIFIAVVVISLMVCYIIRIRRKSTCTMEPDRPHAVEEFDTDFYLTPIGEQMPLPMILANDGPADRFNTAQNEPFDSSMGLLHRNLNMCMDGYEMVDISSNRDSKCKLNNNENNYESAETIKTSTEDSSGYLTVLGVLETSV